MMMALQTPVVDNNEQLNMLEVRSQMREFFQDDVWFTPEEPPQQQPQQHTLPMANGKIPRFYSPEQILFRRLENLVSLRRRAHSSTDDAEEADELEEHLSRVQLHCKRQSSVEAMAGLIEKLHALQNSAPLNENSPIPAQIASWDMQNHSISAPLLEPRVLARLLQLLDCATLILGNVRYHGTLCDDYFVLVLPSSPGSYVIVRKSIMSL